MALKHKLSAADYAALPALIKAEYRDTSDPDGSHVLEVEGLEDTSVLKRTIDHVKKERDEAKKKLSDELKAVREELETVRNDQSKGDEKLTAAEKRHAALLAKREAELKTEITGLNPALTSQLVDSVASNLAVELAGPNSELMLPFIKGRLRAEVRDGKAITVVLDESGAESVLTPAELKKNLVDSKKFDAILIGNKSSGAGGTGSKPGGAGGQTGPKKISEMNATEQAQFANKNPEAYRTYLAEKAQ
jgi:hypothetical protein